MATVARTVALEREAGGRLQYCAQLQNLPPQVAPWKATEGYRKATVRWGLGWEKERSPPVWLLAVTPNLGSSRKHRDRHFERQRGTWILHNVMEPAKW